MKFEENLRELELLVNQLEKGEMPLEKSIELFEKGVALSKICINELKECSGRIETIKTELDEIIGGDEE